MKQEIESSNGDMIPCLRCTAVTWQVSILGKRQTDHGDDTDCVEIMLEATDQHGTVFAVLIAETASAALDLATYLSEIAAKAIAEGGKQ